MTDPAHQPVLHALFRLSRDTRHISAVTLAQAAATTPTVAARILVELERAGLVDASRARLTMRGLAAAVASGATQGGPAADPPTHQIGRREPAGPRPLAAMPAHGVADESTRRPRDDAELGADGVVARELEEARHIG